MASVLRRNDGARIGWRVRFYLEKRRRELYLPNVSKKVAEAVGRHLDELSGAKGLNSRAAPESIAWAAGTDGVVRDRLVAWGLADPANPKLLTDAGRYLEAFATAYIDGRTDIAANTSRNFRQAQRVLVEYFGAKHSIRSITAEDAERWKRWLLAQVVKAATETEPARTMAQATMSMYVRRAKTMFSAAVRDQLLDSNPFAGLKTGSDRNSERLRFIDAKTSKLVLDACPDADWRVLFSLARYGGLRCPSEVLSLRWVDVDWAAGRLRIDSPKTGLRFCPLFPELKTALEEAWELAPDGAVYCVGRYHGGATNLRTQLGRILATAGIIPWPKLFQNLRSSRRTELQELYPDHVLNTWLGQSSKVAEGHYLTVTDDHWSRAVDSGYPTGYPIPADQEDIENHHDTKKPLKNKGSDGSRCLPIVGIVPPARIELTTRL